MIAITDKVLSIDTKAPDQLLPCPKILSHSVNNGMVKGVTSCAVKNVFVHQVPLLTVPDGYLSAFIHILKFCPIC